MKLYALTLALCSAAALACPGFAHAGQKARIIKSSFTENWRRYPSPDEILNKFRLMFPGEIVSVVPADCQRLTPNNRALLGDSNAANGRPSIDRPNASFVNWYATCLAEYIKAENQLSKHHRKTPVHNANGAITDYNYGYPDLKDLRKLYGQALIDDCLKSDNSDQSLKLEGDISYFTCRWSKLETASKILWIKDVVEQYVGPEEIVVDQGLAGSADEFAARVLDSVEAFNAAPDTRYDFILAPTKPLAAGELKLSEAAMIVKMLIGIQDTLMY